MANKIFSIYSHEAPRDEDIKNDLLIIEIAKTHMACILKSGSKNSIGAFEVFKIQTDKEDFEDVFRNVQLNSKLLGKPYNETKIYIQNEMSVLVPADEFKIEIADDYLNIALGENADMVMMTDHLQLDYGLVNIYRSPMNIISALNSNIGKIIVEHTYTQVLRALFNVIKTSPGQIIKIQFYTQHLIVTVFSGKKLQLIQTFNYKSHINVLYYLLNIVERLGLEADTLSVEISGMIDLNSPLYNELFRYFKNISVENANTDTFHLDASMYPLHYFTPIFNLAI